MAKGQYLTPHQRGIVKRFYEHRDSLAQQKLGDLVTDLWLAETPKKVDQLWAKVDKALSKTSGNEAWVAQIVKNRDLDQLARIVAELF